MVISEYPTMQISKLLRLGTVVVEKPFTNTTAEANELIELVKKVGKTLTVYQSESCTSQTRAIQVYELLELASS